MPNSRCKQQLEIGRQFGKIRPKLRSERGKGQLGRQTGAIDILSNRTTALFDSRGRQEATIDELGNRYAPSAAPDDAKGIGRVQANRADPQFVLRPGETRAATFGQARVMRGTPNAAVIGSSYTFDISIAQLEVLYNGQQVRTVREHSMTFPNFTPAASGAAAAAGAPAGGPDAEDIKKAGEAIRNIFRGRGK